MQIQSSNSYSGPAATKAASSADATRAASGTETSTLMAGTLKSKGDDVVQKFLNYAKMSPMDRMRANILNSMGMTEDDLKKMTPEQQKAVEQRIEQLIQQEPQKNAGKTGQVVDLTA